MICSKTVYQRSAGLPSGDSFYYIVVGGLPMKKAALVAVSILAFCIPGVADDLSFVLAAVDTHPEVLLEIPPTYAKLGVKYSGFEFLPGRSTEVIVLAGGGFGQMELWTDLDGIPFDPASISLSSDAVKDARIYDYWRIDWSARLQQYFGKPAVYFEYAGWWDTTAENGESTYAFAGPASVYPDQDGSFANSLQFGTFVDTLTMGALSLGYRAELFLRAAPSYLGNQVIGATDFYHLSGLMTGYLPLYSMVRENELNTFSVYFADRFVADWVFGNAVPRYVQRPLALGTKMRGFERNSFTTAFTVVNNAEIRVAGPELLFKNLYPFATLFVDLGYYGAQYLNTDYVRSGFLAAAGFEIAANLLGLTAIGYRGAFVLAGENMENRVFSGSLMVSFQF